MRRPQLDQASSVPYLKLGPIVSVIGPITDQSASIANWEVDVDRLLPIRYVVIGHDQLTVPID